MESTSVADKERSRELCEVLELLEAGCPLPDESSALPMTAKLRLRRGGMGASLGYGRETIVLSPNSAIEEGRFARRSRCNGSL